MQKAFFSIVFFIVSSIFSIQSILADGAGDILLVTGTGYLTNVYYIIINESGKAMIHGVSGNNGWITYHEPVAGNYTLVLDFNPYLPWNFEENENLLREEENLTGEYETINVVQERATRLVRVRLEGNKKYIIKIRFQEYGISE